MPRAWVTRLLASTPDKRLWAWDLPPTPSLCLSIATLGGSQAFPVPDLSCLCRLCMNADTPGQGGPENAAGASEQATVGFIK